MNGIFLSYRRSDSAGDAGRLYERLASRYEAERVFQDIDTIEPGADLAELINGTVEACDVMLVVIGRRWLETEELSGRRRIDEPRDFVHLEIKAALDRGVPILPVLIQGADPLNYQELPEDIALLAQRQPANITDNRWHDDVDQLIRLLANMSSQ
jgi:TIR domain